MHSSPSTEFDAYHKWLGIPPAEQPPDCYRLLGLALFEDDVEVIAAAADRQMIHVKSFAAGRNAAAAQALLNELARARVTLLNEQQKLVYDRRLKESQRKPVETASDEPAGKEDHADQESFAPQSSEQFGLSFPELDPWRLATRRTKHRKSPLPAQILLTTIILGLAGGVILVVVNRQIAPSAAKTAPNHAVSSPPTAHFLEPPTSTHRPLTVASPQMPIPPIANDRSTDRQSAPRKPEGEKQRRRPQPVVQDRAAEVIDLSLDNRRQVHEVANKAMSHFRVLAVRGCGSAYFIPDERLDEKSKARIEINGIRRVVIELSLRKNDNKALVVVECGAVNDEGNVVPLTLANIRAICTKISRQGDQAVAELDALQQEKTQLETWIKAPIVKPLADVGAARTRVMTLEILIRDAQQRVQSISSDFQVAERVEQLAMDLHKSCKIELAEISKSERVEVGPKPTGSDQANGL